MLGSLLFEFDPLAMLVALLSEYRAGGFLNSWLVAVACAHDQGACASRGVRASRVVLSQSAKSDDRCTVPETRV